MLSQIKALSRKLKRKAIGSILLIVVLPIIALRLLGFLQWAEFIAYDLLIHFSPAEPQDERIVLVGWHEQDLQMSQEMTMSDQTLVSVLEKIKAQQPRLIGLDLYRDIPYFSRVLEKQQNEQAYARLQEIFRDTPNLVGIEKVIEPIINPPPVLKEEKRVFSSDIITDTDNFVRRSFIDPQPRQKKDDSTTSRAAPYLGTVLGTEYLVAEGWEAKSLDNGSLRIFKGESERILENVKPTHGGYIKDPRGWDFLVNWRRGFNVFETVSLDKLLQGKIPTDLFRDKLVLVGNVASSTADRHYLPIRRWDEIQAWTYGLYLPAHVASSIISAALDGRPLIKVAPWGSGYILCALSIFSTASLIFKYSNWSTQKLYTFSALFSLILTVLLIFGSLLAFQFGWWIPIIPAVLGIWLTFITVNNHVHITKEQDNVLKLELISTDLNHQLGNSSNLITLSISSLRDYSQTIHQILLKEHKEDQELGVIDQETNLQETDKGQALTVIDEEIAEIDRQVDIVTRYRERTTQFIKLTCSRKKPEKQITNVNEFVKQIVEKVTQEKLGKYRHEITMEEAYGSDLKQAKIDRLSLEIILDNLIDNAFDATESQLDREPSYRPTIRIETQKRNNWIEIIVKDNGRGINKQQQRIIFQPFVSFKTDKGQGIGLFLVKELLKLEQGDIQVESTPGEGSKFIVSLPRNL